MINEDTPGLRQCVCLTQVFSQDARREMDYYIMPRATYPHGMLTSQVLLQSPLHG